MIRILNQDHCLGRKIDNNIKAQKTHTIQMTHFKFPIGTVQFANQKRDI